MLSKNHHLNSLFNRFMFAEVESKELCIEIDYLDYDYLTFDYDFGAQYWIRLAREKEEVYRTLFGKRKKYYVEYDTQFEIPYNPDKDEYLVEMINIKYGDKSFKESLFYQYLSESQLEEEYRMKNKRYSESLIRMIKEDFLHDDLYRKDWKPYKNKESV